MTKTRKSPNGICISCDEGDKCTYPKNEENPTIHCEEFKQPESSKPKKCNDKPCAENSDTDKAYKGLCKNCENRKQCNLPRPEGGVLHCQEYR